MYYKKDITYSAFVQSLKVSIIAVLSLLISACSLFESKDSCNTTTDVSERYDWEELAQFTHKAHIRFNDERSQEEAREFASSLGYTTLGFFVNGVVVELPCGTDAVNEVFNTLLGCRRVSSNHRRQQFC